MKVRSVILLAAALFTYANVANAMGDKNDESLYEMRPQFCARAIPEQVKEEPSLVSVRIGKVYGDRPASVQGACRYDVHVLERLYNATSVPENIAIIHESPKMDIKECYSVGNTALLMLTSKALEADRVRCTTSAIYPESDRGKILELLTKR